MMEDFIDDPLEDQIDDFFEEHVIDPFGVEAPIPQVNNPNHKPGVPTDYYGQMEREDYFNAFEGIADVWEEWFDFHVEDIQSDLEPLKYPITEVPIKDPTVPKESRPIAPQDWSDGKQIQRDEPFQPRYYKKPWKSKVRSSHTGIRSGLSEDEDKLYCPEREDVIKSEECEDCEHFDEDECQHPHWSGIKNEEQEPSE